MPAIWLLYAQQFMGALIVAGLVPVMGYYIVDGLGHQPWMMGVYSAITLITALVCNRLFGKQIDQGHFIKPRLLLTILFCFLNMSLLAAHTSIWIICLVNALLFGIGNGSLSIMYSFGRLFAEQTGRNPQKLNARLRLCVSAGWMIGPAVSFQLIAIIGFAPLFASLAVMTGLWAVICWYTIPSDFKTHIPPAKPHDASVSMATRYKVLIVNIPILGIGLANSFFLSSMALYFSQTLRLPVETAGYGLMIKCFVEVIVIFLSVKLAQKIGNRLLLAVAALTGCLFYLLMGQASSQMDVFLLEGLDGFYYGVFAAISLIYVQNHVPDRIGVATAYYVNALFLSGFIGNLGMGVIATFYGYGVLLWISAACTLMALVSLMVVELIYRPISSRVESI